MLFNQEDPDLYEHCKEKLLKDILNLINHYRGPFYAGEEFSAGDVLMAPYFCRLCVLKHYRGFSVPVDEKFARWYEWKENVLNHKAVKPTRLKEE